MTSFQPELWVDHAARALEFYSAAFGASVLHLVGEGDDIVAQLSVDGAVFWIATADPDAGRFSPRAIHGATGRTLLVSAEPQKLIQGAIDFGATVTSPLSEEHGWRLGRVVDPFGHEWEIGTPLGT